MDRTTGYFCLSRQSFSNHSGINSFWVLVERHCNYDPDQSSFKTLCGFIGQRGSETRKMPEGGIRCVYMEARAPPSSYWSAPQNPSWRSQEKNEKFNRLLVQAAEPRRWNIGEEQLSNVPPHFRLLFPKSTIKPDARSLSATTTLFSIRTELEQFDPRITPPCLAGCLKL